MKSIKLILIIMVVVLLASFIIGGSFIGYEKYKDAKQDEADLMYNTQLNWIWYDKYNRIQMSYSEESGLSTLRKLNHSDHYMIYVQKVPSYDGFITSVFFKTDCKPNSVITTNKKYSNGKFKKLTCTEEGDDLRHDSAWESSRNFNEVIWQENLGGFSLYENFSNWDVSKLEQEISLLTAAEPISDK